MAIKQTKRAVERHLSLLSPSLPTAYEASKFNPPSTMYQVIRYSINPPDDPVLGTGYYRERIQMQVFVVGPINEGTGDVLDRAELIRNQFKKGTFLTEDGVDIHILSTPQISGTAITENRVVCPILIDLVSEVQVSY